MPKRTSPAKSVRSNKDGHAPLRVVIVTLDGHLHAAVRKAEADLHKDLPNLTLTMHAAATWQGDPSSLEQCREDLFAADIIVANMLFMEEHINAVRDVLEARREDCAALVVCMAESSVCALTHMGSLDMSSQDGGGLSWLKKLRGNRDNNKAQGAGAAQMAMLRRLPQMLRFIPGTAQDLRMYFLTMQYWLSGSHVNIANLVRNLVSRYAASAVSQPVKVAPPVEYPQTGLYHPKLKQRITCDANDISGPAQARGTVGLIVMRSYVLAENTAHFDCVIEALEARQLRVLPAFASGLDARAAVETFFLQDDQPTVDAVISLTGFSLVGGPAYNDSDSAVSLLKRLDLPYLTAQALEFQSLDEWQDNERGLLPIETMMMVAIPELDGATSTMVFGGRNGAHTAGMDAGEMQLEPHAERVSMLAARVARLIALRKRQADERRLAVVVYDFPPNSGATGSAAYLDVFASLHELLKRLQSEGYAIDCPDSAEQLRDALLEGNSAKYGTAANVHAVVDTASYIAAEPHLADIEKVWGAAPGNVLSNGRGLLVQGVEFGNVFVGVQPHFGYEGDPMRLMFEGGLAPNHATAAFYGYLKQQFAADVVLHFGMHGSLEFMPGKQVGLDATCWPDRLIGDLPHVYLYAANNPSEAALAKRRAQATIVTHLTPAISHAGLYDELRDLKDLLMQYQEADPGAAAATTLLELIREKAQLLELECFADQVSEKDALDRLSLQLNELEQTLIPTGLHVLGQPHTEAQRFELLTARAGDQNLSVTVAQLRQLAATPHDPKVARQVDNEQLVTFAQSLAENQELDAVVHALDGGYTPPVPGGDLLRNDDILPTGRNIHGFDPSRLPSQFAVAEGARQAEMLLTTLASVPRSMAMVLWGTDALKNGGVAIGQALRLMGCAPRFDAYGRLAGAELIPLEALGRARVDVLLTISGIFRDLLPKQIQLLAEAALLCASADEPHECNPIRAHAVACQQAHDVTLETAALRVFGNAEAAYGANVNHMVDSGRWHDEAELGELFAQRRSFAYGMDARAVQQADMFSQALADVELTFQNLDSLELGVTTLDHYVDSLGGIARAIRNVRGDEVPTYIGDHTQGQGVVRSLVDQIALETRTRMLNPRWYDAMLEHGREGVHQIEAHITNTMGWSATTGQVAPWVYQEISKTFVLDDQMRERLAELNPTASVKLANRLVEAQERDYWAPDQETLAALHRAGAELEDRLEGVVEGALV